MRRRRWPRRRAPAPSARTSPPKRMINVSSWSIRNPIPAVLLFILLTPSALMGFRAMKVQNFPDIDLPTVTVTASLPGASPSQLETEVARKIENSSPRCRASSTSTPRCRTAPPPSTVEFRLEKPTQEAVDDVRDAVVARALRPAGRPARPDHHEDRPRRLADPDLHRRLDAHGRRGAVLVRRQRRRRKRLLAVRGVGAVTRVGGVTREVRVELDPARLLALNATAADISRQLRQIAAGSVGRPRRRRRRRAIGAHHRHGAVGRTSWRRWRSR